MIAPVTVPVPRPGVVVSAVPDDAPEIARLVRRCGPETIPVSEEHVRRHATRFWTLRLPGAGIVATGALLPAGPGRAELRSVAVSPDWRGLGLGRRLVRAVMEIARREGRRVLCVTLEPRFFRRLGFRRVPLASLPAKPEREDVVEGRPRVAMAWEPAPAPVPAAVTA